MIESTNSAWPYEKKLHERIEELESDLAIVTAELNLLKLDRDMKALSNTRDIYHGEKIVQLNVELESELTKARARIDELEERIAIDGWVK